MLVLVTERWSVNQPRRVAEGVFSNFDIDLHRYSQYFEKAESILLVASFFLLDLCFHTNTASLQSLHQTSLLTNLHIHEGFFNKRLEYSFWKSESTCSWFILREEGDSRCLF